MNNENQPYNEQVLCAGNSIFPGFNDNHGLMICGYEFGYSKADNAADLAHPTGNAISWNPNAFCVFSNKGFAINPPNQGRALDWRYDQQIIKFFRLWQHPLQHPVSVTDIPKVNTAGNFEKSILQTNWCNSQNHHVDGSYKDKLLDSVAIEHFIDVMQKFKPKLIIFCGSQMIQFLQTPNVITQFQNIFGSKNAAIYKTRNDLGRRFRIWFQEFEKTQVICIPHPSSSHGLRDDYIAAFSTEIAPLIAKYKTDRKF